MLVHTKSRLTAMALILALLFTPILSMTGQTPASTTDKIYSIVLSTIERMRADGITSKNAKSMNAAQRYSSSVIQFDAQGRIGLMLVVREVTPMLTQTITGAGGDVRFISDDWKNLSVYMPIDMVQTIAELPEVLIVRPLMGGTTSVGLKTSEGDSIHHAVNVRDDLGVKGDSVRIGVISDGCFSWAQSKANGDLPSNFTAANFTFSNGVMNVSGDEDTAMMEIVHDLAPNADIFFYGALGVGGGFPTMNNAIQQLVREKHCQIIVDDVTYWGEPMFEDGTVATQVFPARFVQWAIDTGVVYISSAGNWAKGGITDRSHYQSTFADINLLTAVPQPPPPGPPKPVLPNGPIVAPYPFPFDNLHDFGVGINDVGLEIITPAAGEAISTDLVVVLQWTNAWQGANDDYDLYLYDKNLNFKVAQSVNVQNGFIAQDPYEIITLTHEPFRETLNVVINHFSKPVGAPDALLGLYIYDCYKVEHNTSQNSIWGHPGIPGAIAVGAVPYNNITHIESYSSNGNYDVYFPGYVSRPKPDIVAVDGCQITGVGPFPKGGGGRFWGTSAAAPHVAGMAGLLLSKCPTMTPAQVHSKFERTAVDLGSVGFDAIYGQGRADIERAMLELNTTVSASGPYTISNTVNVPMFFATPDGYAMNTVTITGGMWQPNTVSSSVTITAGSPYTSAGIVELGCPTVHRWYQLAENAGIPKMYSAVMTSYIDESERSTAGIVADSLQLLHWNGKYFEILRQTTSPTMVGTTWKLKASYPGADFSPFFVGYLTRGIDAATVSSDSGEHGSIVPVVFSIQNKGNGWDTLKFSVRDTHGWTFAPTDSGISLSASQKKNITVRVTVSSTDTAGTIDSLWLLAKSVSDSTYVDSTVASVRVTSRVITMSCKMVTGWNMVSVPMTMADCRKTTIYPTAISSAYGYSNNYYVEDTLENCVGYWVKYSDSELVGMSGIPCAADTVDVVTGWNMIGSLSTPIPTTQITSDPGGMITSRFFSYEGTYVTRDSIQPGKGYWVKVSQNGKLILDTASSVVSASHRIRIVSTKDLPPNVPDGTEAISAIPKMYALEQNYPNPFNPTTTISYQLPTQSHVTLKIFDVLGREVATLVNGVGEPGYKSVTFSANRLPSGVYYYRLQAGTNTETKKLLLMK